MATICWVLIADDVGAIERAFADGSTNFSSGTSLEIVEIIPMSKINITNTDPIPRPSNCKL